MRLILSIALLTAAMAGCTTGEDTGSASIYVKDAPTDEFDEIHVVFTAVEIHRAGDSDGNASEGGWITVYENATGQDIDLLNASGAKAAFLGESDLEAGKYTQIRIDAIEAYGMQNGSKVPIALPGKADLKLNHPFDIEADQDTQIIIDFDLDAALKQTPQGWRLTPVFGETQTRVVADSESGEEVHAEGEVTTVE